MALKLGNFSSWTVETGTVAIKHCDITAHVYGLTTIDKRIAEFFDAHNMGNNDEMHVILRYQGHKAQAKIDTTNRGQIRLYFTPVIKQYLSEIDYLTHAINLSFQKNNDGSFEVTAEEDIQIDLNEDGHTIVELPDDGSEEGAKKVIYTTRYERNQRNKKLAIKIHGYKCMACGFDFAEKYGKWGKNFIEVHHVKPLHYLGERVRINPRTDLVCLCSNCHRMIHRKKGEILEVKDLIDIIAKQKN